MTGFPFLPVITETADGALVFAAAPDGTVPVRPHRMTTTDNNIAKMLFFISIRSPVKWHFPFRLQYYTSLYAFELFPYKFIKDQPCFFSILINGTVRASFIEKELFFRCFYHFIVFLLQ